MNIYVYGYGTNTGNQFVARVIRVTATTVVIRRQGFAYNQTFMLKTGIEKGFADMVSGYRIGNATLQKIKEAFENGTL